MLPLLMKPWLLCPLKTMFKMKSDKIITTKRGRKIKVVTDCG